MSNETPLLCIDRLTVRYGMRAAIADLSLEVGGSEIVALLGPNGAGKTTLLRAIAGIARCDSGSITVAGAREPRLRERGVTLVPENPTVYDELSADEHLAFVARGRRLAPSWQTEATTYLERFELAHVRTAPTATFSKGMRQRLLVVAALLVHARVVLFDEPMVGLDPLAQKTLIQAFGELRARGAAVVVSTHQLEAAAQSADRVVILDRGALTAELRPHEFGGSDRRSRPRTWRRRHADDRTCSARPGPAEAMVDRRAAVAAPGRPVDRRGRDDRRRHRNGRFGGGRGASGS